ncbi:DUF6877 family protein [Vagococcus hydrophili]|uniref:DUF6877 domain-containing protein n=1 Tax=Vagococcus hydrophili TaxID=2714947 RepID=A0A6G8APY7_9ENTE|nr:DUF6877 family protein [Vagococcus hydrophili]QIL47066.1 hypothetical protein G7082_00235 [Vagococcus hydrophili]
MQIQERISEAASHIPGNIALVVLTDVDKRISDWKASGGKDEDSYMEQQARYVEHVADVFKQKHSN